MFKLFKKRNEDKGRGAVVGVNEDSKILDAIYSVNASECEKTVGTSNEENLPQAAPRTGHSSKSAKDIFFDLENNNAEKESPYKDFPLPSLQLLERSINIDIDNRDEQVSIIKQALKANGISTTVESVNNNPVVTRFLLTPELGTKVSQLKNVKESLMLNLGTKDVRVAPILGTNLVGITVPNAVKGKVKLRPLLESIEMQENSSRLAFPVGLEQTGGVIVSDLKKLPHLLIGGTTGSGKSNFVNSMIMTLLMCTKPDEVGIVIIDTAGLEYNVYSGMPHLIKMIATTPDEAICVLQQMSREIEFRRNILQSVGAVNIDAFNTQYDSGLISLECARKMKEIVIFVDFFAELLNSYGREIEEPILNIIHEGARLGMHIVLASQKPYEKIVSQRIKLAISAKASMRVASTADSVGILGMEGAEALLGDGHMLYVPNGPLSKTEIYTAYISDKERKEVVGYWIGSYPTRLTNIGEAEKPADNAIENEKNNSYDELFYKSALLCIEEGKASSSLLQRKFNIGFNRAAKIIDQLYEFGVAGPPNGSKPREILMDAITMSEKWFEVQG